jgi:hypothetical protein
MKTISISIFCLLLSALSVPAATNTLEDKIRTEGDWTIVTITLLQDTRSQITLGKLKYKKTEVIGEAGHMLDTSLGRFVWRGSYDKGYSRGWIPLDSDTKDLISAELPLSTLGGLYYTKKKG